MKPVTNSSLITFLENATTYVRADLYVFALNNGTVLRYTSASIPISSQIISTGSTVVGPYTFNVGPPIQDSGVQSGRGIKGASVDITILGGDGRFTVNGIDILDFIEGYGLDGSTISIHRAFAATWADMAVSGPVGSYCRFSGLYSEAKELGQTQVVVTVQSPLSLLSQPYPPEDYGTSCNNVFGDSRCGVNLPALTKTGTVSGTPTAIAFDSSISGTDGFYNLGAVTFTSGANEAQSRMVKTFAASGGLITLSAPLPVAPASGDTFTISPGCLLSLAQCQFWDSPPGGPSPAYPYTQRFRATPFVPPPSTGLPI